MYISSNVIVGIPHNANRAVQMEQVIQFTLVLYRVIKGILHFKIKILSSYTPNNITLMLFQTCMNFFLLLNRK